MSGSDSPLPLGSIHIVIVTYRPAAGMLEDAVASVVAAAHSVAASVTIEVVDNGGQVAGRLAPWADAIRVTTSPRNGGFAAAVNIGFRHGLEAGAGYLVCLNDDVTVSTDWLAPLVEALVIDPRLGGVQPLLLDADGHTIDGAGVMIDKYGAGSDRLRGEPIDTATRAEVTAVTGGAAMFRSSFIEDVGLMDERFFLYYEDVEWCRRGAAANWKFAVIPESVVYHRGSATTAELGDQVRMWQDRNRLWTLALHGTTPEIVHGLSLSFRRLRHRPHSVHLRSLVGGLGGMPTRLVERWRR